MTGSRPHPAWAEGGRPRGLVSLGLGSLMLLGLVILAGLGLRALLAELKAAHSQVQTLRAREAAEAGAAWGQVFLNQAQVAGLAGCGMATLRDSLLQPLPASGALQPVPVEAGQRAGCRLDPGGPACDCPAAVPGLLSPPALGGSAPAFTLRLQAPAGSAAAAVGGLLMRVEGCSQALGACLGGTGPEAPARAQLTVGLQLRPLLQRLPRAALTAGGRARLCAPLHLENQDPAEAGLLVHAGLALERPGAAGGLAPCPAGLALCSGEGCAGLRLHVPPGLPALEALVGPDAALSLRLGTQEALSRSIFGLPPELARQAPGWQRVEAASAGDAAARLVEAVAAGARRVWIEGPLTLDAPGELGSPASPLLLWVDGPVHWRGGGRLHGLLLAPALRVDPPAPGPEIHGGVLLSGDFDAEAALWLRHDAELLQRLRAQSSLLLPQPGSLRDF